MLLIFLGVLVKIKCIRIILDPEWNELEYKIYLIKIEDYAQFK